MSATHPTLLCEICGRPQDPTGLPFFCTVDARNVCYENRLRMLRALMRNESLQNRIDGLVSESQAKCDNPTSSVLQPTRKLTSEYLVSRRSLVQDRTEQILARAEKLQADISRARAEVATKRESIARRRSDLVSASAGIDARRSKAFNETENMTLLVRSRWNRCSDQTAATRAFLCMEAARLYGLRRVKKGASKYEFKLGGIDVVDLASMNALSPEVISTSLSHISHILILASHYLALRLPAEILMPCRDHPQPTIYNLASSYRHGDRDSQTLNIKPLSSGPTPSNYEPSLSFPLDRQTRDTGTFSRPRPLFIDKPLPVLAREDPCAHAFFLEGVTLLAYDVSWACLTQNIPIGDRASFDDVCNMGRNLYNLLIGQKLHTQTTKLYHHRSSHDISEADNTGQEAPSTTTPMMGRFSHGTTHAFLASAEGTDFIRSFKLPSPIKLADKLKKKLLSELSVPEWEVVETEDWVFDGGT